VKHHGDKDEVRAAIVRAAAAAHPGALEREDLDTEPAICRADGRTVNGEIKRLVHAGCLQVLDLEIPSGRPRRFKASTPMAVAVKAVVG
jgi:hypothetical protein